MIDVMTSDGFAKAQQAFLAKAKPHDTGIYEDWLRLHTPLVAVARRFGTVVDSGDGDFYHPGDWFTSNVDGFALLTGKPLSKVRLEEFQSVLTEHSPDSIMTLAGDICTEVDGLEILVHPTAILVAWSKCSRAECLRKLHDFQFKAA